MLHYLIGDKMKTVRYFLVLCLLFTLPLHSACSENMIKFDSEEIRVDKVYFDKFNVSSDNTFLHIIVKTNPTTGFNWYVKDFDEGALAVHETKYEKLDKDEAKLAGAPSLADIKIEALKQGMFSFCLSYMRNWEGGEVIETYRFDVESDGDRKICVKNVKKILNN